MRDEQMVEREGAETWWKVESHKDVPRPVEVVRHSASSVWTVDAYWTPPRERRHNRTGEWVSFFPTEAEAVAYMRQGLESAITRTRADLHRHRSALGSLEAYAKRRGIHLAAPPPDPPAVSGPSTREGSNG